MHPCTVRPPEGPFRRALLSGTASDTPQADKLATHAEHTGGWPIIAAAAAATQPDKTGGQRQPQSASA